MATLRLKNGMLTAYALSIGMSEKSHILACNMHFALSFGLGYYTVSAYRGSNGEYYNLTHYKSVSHARRSYKSLIRLFG